MLEGYDALRGHHVKERNPRRPARTSNDPPVVDTPPHGCPDVIALEDRDKVIVTDVLLLKEREWPPIPVAWAAKAKKKARKVHFFYFPSLNYLE